MGYLIEKTALKLLVNGDGLVDNFIKNSTELAQLYTKSTDDVKVVSSNNVKVGGFYHLVSQNKSNWMRNAPVFVVSQKKNVNFQIEEDNGIIKSGVVDLIYAINLNLIPLEVRVLFFDEYISEKDFEKDNFLKVSHEGVSNALKSIGFEYALMPFIKNKIIFSHKISMHMVPKFLIHQHPTNKYDPKKLLQIWESKIQNSNQRDAEMKKAIIDDFTDYKKDVDGKYKLLKEHIMRLRRNL